MYEFSKHIKHQLVGGGYIGVSRESRTSGNKAKRTTIVLFNALRRGGLYKNQLQRLMAVANNRLNYRGYCDSTIAWHITNGRFSTTKEGRNTVIRLTPKGFEYAIARGIF